jgi:DNA invertase Pin-like site-specific DNA recombinase
MPKPQTTAYLRVSTDDQDIEKNKYDIPHLANEKGLGKVAWVDETVSGRLMEEARNRSGH